MDSPRAALRALLAVAGAVLIIGAIVAIRPSLVKKASHPTSSPSITYAPTSSSTPTVTAATTVPATTVPPTTAPATTAPATTAPATTAPATTAPATTAPAKGPSALARTGISTDPVYVVALILILAGTTLVWMEERLRLLGMISAGDPNPRKSRYQPQHARRRR